MGTSIQVLARNAPQGAAAALCASTIELGEAISIFREICAEIPKFDQALLKYGREDGAEHLSRILSMLTQVSDGKRLAPGLLPLLRTPHAYIRAQVAGLLARASDNTPFLLELMGDEDPRVRAIVVEEHKISGDHWPVIGLGIRDSHHRVICNSVVRLFEVDQPQAFRILAELAESEDWHFRAAAAWVMGVSKCPEALPMAQKLRQDNNPRVRFNALRAIRTLSEAGHEALKEAS